MARTFREGDRTLISRFEWIVAQFTRRLWFRAALYGVVAVVTALVAAETSRFFPEGMANVIGAEAVEGILKILASSMLAVATFSLGTMVAALSTAARSATPRAAKLLVEDPTSQNALATFIGAFIFSLIGIIALSTGYYGAGGRVVLFAVTVVVVLIIIATFFRWIDYLSHLGRLEAVIDKVEAATTRAMRDRCRAPNLGGRPSGGVPDDAVPLASGRIGYIRHIDVPALSEIAERGGGEIHVAQLPGAFTDGRQPVAWLTWHPGEEQAKEIRQAFLIGSERSYDQDPRFGLIVLSEIASRALSPGVNDPGTAIDVIGRLVRVLSLWTGDREAEADAACTNVFVPGETAEDLFEDAFGAIARDGAGTVEVGIRLQKALGSLAEMGGGEFREAARHQSERALIRARAALTLEEDRERLEALAVPPG